MKLQERENDDTHYNLDGSIKSRLDKMLRASLEDMTLQSNEPSRARESAAGMDHSVRIVKAK